jgi:PEP-CTERM motif
MKKRVVCVFTLCLFAIVPASAGVLYTNGALNGGINAWNITQDEVTDSFVISSAGTMTSFDFATWNYPSQVISNVNWAVGTTNYGTDVASGTSAVSAFFEGIYGDGYYPIYTNTVSGLSVGLDAGTYWLTLTSASVPTGAYWDQNNGPSTAYQDATGQLPGSNAFTIYSGTSVPEPGSMALLGGGILLMLGALRRKIG